MIMTMKRTNITKTNMAHNNTIMPIRKRLGQYSFFLLPALFLLVLLWTLWGNTALSQRQFTISSQRIPASFSGFRIAHVSDLHNAEFGKENEKLLTLLQESEPDIIVITGDIVDSSRIDISIAVDFAKGAMTVAPCYYVTGNHEAAIDTQEYAELEQNLRSLGITILHNEGVILTQEDATICLAGIDDPAFLQTSTDALAQLKNHESYSILLSHRPELFSQYVQTDFDLVFSGHAHGGQFRLPFIGGIVAPNQGFFPKYDSGLYTAESTNMIVSRGLGNSIIPLRFNNRPEVIVVRLQAISSSQDKAILQNHSSGIHE